MCHSPTSNLFEDIVEFPERSKPAHILSHLSLSCSWTSDRGVFDVVKSSIF